MNSPALATVVVADVVDSRAAMSGSTAWLRALTADLDERYRDARIAPFGFTQGDELQGLLAVDADPLVGFLVASLHPERRRMRWAIAAGEVEPGEGPATERTGAAFIEARRAITGARKDRLGLVMSSGSGDSDALLADVTPVLAELLEDLSPLQRSIGRLMLVDGRRQAEVAEALGVARPTVSVAHARGRLHSIARLVRASKAIFTAGVATRQVDAGARDDEGARAGTAPG
jgi:hypothetical protein